MTKLYLKLQNGVKVMRESDIGHETIAGDERGRLKLDKDASENEIEKHKFPKKRTEENV